MRGIDGSRQLNSIQYLRAASALIVVLHHARNPIRGFFNPLEHFDAFAWGVDVFL
jgi:exopolysaccharide production protein ExoZ